MDDRSDELRVDWRIAAGVAAALALLFTAQNYLAPPAIRAGASLARLFQLQVITWGSWLALSPWIIAAAFAALALLLAAVGIYGVLAFTVSQRRREMGVRLALGSTAAGVFRLVLLDGMRMLTAGLAIGLLAAAFVGRLLRAQLYAVTTADPRVIGGAAALLAVIATAAIAIPSWRASRIDPAATLNG